MTAAPSDVADDSRRPPLRIGGSACLLGQQVRFDGGHKGDPFLTETFGRFVEWVREIILEGPNMLWLIPSPDRVATEPRMKLLRLE